MNTNFEKNVDKNILNTILKLLYALVKSECCFVQKLNSGSSLSEVYLFKSTNNKMYAAKVCNKNLLRVSIFKEAENKKKLEKFLNNHLSSIIYTGDYDIYEIMISECYGVDTLYSFIINKKSSIKCCVEIWKDILTNLMNMWLNTKNFKYKVTNNPRNPFKRITRIEQALKSVKYNNYDFESIWDLDIIVNDVICPSLKKSFEIIRNLGVPNFGVLCHGDPQPTNIIISNDKNWYFVDWEWSGENQDFRAMFSHLFGWWPTRMIDLNQQPQLIINKNNIIINYNLPPLDNIIKFQDEAVKKLNEVFEIQATDINDINRYLALLYFGDVRFLNLWNKIDYLPILIGEAVKTLNYIQTLDNKKISKGFTLEV